MLAGATVQDAAQAVGVSADTVSRWRVSEPTYQAIEAAIRQRATADQWAEVVRWSERSNGRLMRDLLRQAFDAEGDPRVALAAKKFILELQGKVQKAPVLISPVLVQFNADAAQRARQLRGDVVEGVAVEAPPAAAPADPTPVTAAGTEETCNSQP